MIRNDEVKNKRYELLQDVKHIMSDPLQPIHPLKELIGSEKYLSFKQEVERQIDDILFPEDFTYEDVEEMLDRIAENYLFDLERDLEAEISGIFKTTDKTNLSSNKRYLECSEKLQSCKNILSEISIAESREALCRE